MEHKIVLVLNDCSFSVYDNRGAQIENLPYSVIEYFQTPEGAEIRILEYRDYDPYLSFSTMWDSGISTSVEFLKECYCPIRYFDQPTQIAFYDNVANHYVGGIGYKDEVICGCCGGVLKIEDIYACCRGLDKRPIIPFSKWVNIGEEIMGDTKVE